jgi:dipeptidyl aminopeptidase/acylaminoacyl peptidase
MPMGSRQQLTFFDEAVKDANFNPLNGSYFIFSKDNGGDEFAQLYRFDFSDKKTTLLTEGGRTQNGNAVWNESGNKILYTATTPGNGNRNVYLLNPMHPEERKEVVRNEGGGWSIADWSKDEQQIILNQSFSINETCIWRFDMSNGSKIKILPKQPERTIYNALDYGKTNDEIYILTNKSSEFTYPALFHISTGKLEPLVKNLSWDVNSYVINKTKTQAAYVVNEAGVSKLFIQNLNTLEVTSVAIPVGVVGNPVWQADNQRLAFSLSTYQSPNDVYAYELKNKKLSRWTESEIGNMDLSQQKAPQLIQWKSFDNQLISGFMYQAPKRFSGKRPVMISIHGGPEGQSLPNFLGRNNYYLNELGITIIYPNVRGSVGYGKTFTDMDNGFKRKESVKDIGALLDWIHLIVIAHALLHARH